MSENIQDTLRERQKIYGDYADHARITQDVLAYWAKQPGWQKLDVCQRETLHMTAHKVGRILCGNPNEPDHWRDVAGYHTLIVNRLTVTPSKEIRTPGSPDDGGHHADPAEKGVAVSAEKGDAVSKALDQFKKSLATRPCDTEG